MMKTKGNHEVLNTEVKVVVFALAVSQKTDLKANPVNVSRIVFTLSTTVKRVFANFSFLLNNKFMTGDIDRVTIL